MGTYLTGAVKGVDVGLWKSVDSAELPDHNFLSRERTDLRSTKAPDPLEAHDLDSLLKEMFT